MPEHDSTATEALRWLQGLPKIGLHALRHTFGRQCTLHGGHELSLQLIVGHNRIETKM